MGRPFASFAVARTRRPQQWSEHFPELGSRAPEAAFDSAFRNPPLVGNVAD
jgi:hypothetical protein